MLHFYPKKITGSLQILVALVILLCTAFFTAQIAYAGSGPAQAQGASRLCVQGTVISHDEKPLTDGWAISAESVALGQTQVITSDTAGGFVFDPLIVDTYHFAITVKPGWEAITPAQFDVPVDYSADCVRIRFKLRRLVEVIVLKIDDDHKPWAGWTICAEPGADNFFATKICQRTDAAGSTTFRLTPGNWTFVETPPAGVPLIPVMPPTDRQSLNVQPPGPYTIRFKNVPPLPTGCIEVFKFDTPPDNQDPFPLPGWHIDVLRADGVVVASGQTDISGRILFCNLPIGPYTVVEELRKAWQPTSDSRYNVTVLANETVTITFYNRQDRGYCFVGRKIDTNGKVGLPGWKITATPVTAGGIYPPAATTDGLGNYRICFPKDDYRVLGASYKICEEMQTGWQPHTPTCYVATLPTFPDAPVLVPDFENQQVGHAESQGGKPSNVPGCRMMHTVKYGEYLSGIAVQYQVSTYSLKLANPWVFGRYQFYIRVGEQLCIPN